MRIDRLGPARRPVGAAAMRQRWSELLFLHWVVPVEALRPLVPAPLEIDLFDGQAYVGLVPFTMTGIRPPWAPAIPGLSAFHEINVRTYVRLGGVPGVWFFSLDAANPLAVLAARALYHLPYRYARMSLVKDGSRVHYSSERRWPGPRPAGCRLSYGPTGAGAPAEPETLLQFLVERYLLYVEARGVLWRGAVHHRPYVLRPARVEDLEENLLASAGIARPAMLPLAQYAEPVDVELFALERV